MPDPKPGAVLSVKLAPVIRRAYLTGNVSQNALARQFGISQASVSRAVLGNWNKRGKGR